MSAVATNLGPELVSKPYLLNDAAAKAYGEGIESPPRRAPRVNIHTDEEAARKAGFHAPIAGGEQTYALMANFIVDSFGIGFMRGGRLEAALVKPVFYGDTLTMHARIVDADSQQLHLELWTENQRGERVLIGTACVPKQSQSESK
jgi:MaoC like domain